MTRDIVILAKSNKHSNYCIAGIDINTCEWIRPVSSLTDIERAVPKCDVIYSNGEELNVFDVVRISFLEHIPTAAQNENYLYDETKRWVKVGELSPTDIEVYDESLYVDYIFGNTEKSITERYLTGKSLLLVKIDDPSVFIKTFETKKISFNFHYNGEEYRYISVGDPNVLEAFNSKNDGIYDLGRSCYAVFSLTDKYQYNGKYYKMLASIISLD